MSQTIHHQVLIVGGGTAGITVAARLCRGWFNKPDVAVIEPELKHYYQPMWTLVGAGVASKESTERTEASVMPRKAKWIQDAVDEFHPDDNHVITRTGQKISYDYLVVAGGIQMNWNKIKGLRDALGHDGVCSNYSYASVDSTWESIRNFKGGTAIFTQPAGAVRCGGAPQKIMYLAEEHFRTLGVREKSNVIFATGGEKLFAIPKYAATLERIVADRDIELRVHQELIEVRPETREAVFENSETGEPTTLHYDMLHVTPPMAAPEFIAQSPLADAAGWVDVNPQTLQHARFANVFGIGDASNLPTSKTGAAIRKQAPILVANLKALMKGQPMTAAYSGYTSCPVVTGYGKLVLAEFDYDKHPTETFPFDQSKERHSMWLLKRYLLPAIYWHGMLKGRM